MVGVATGWPLPNNNATPLERPAELTGRALLTDQEVEALKRSAAQLFDGQGDAAFGDSVFVAALRNVQGFKSTDTTGNYNQFWLVDRDFDNRTSLITDPPDGKLPALTPEGQQKRAAAAEARKLRPADGPENFPLSLRCITFGLPNTFAGYNSYFVDQSANGTSALRVSGSKNLHLIERFTRVGPNTINYESTIDDPTMYTKTWAAMIPLRRSSDKIYEFACHEGNESMTGSLSGARYLERTAEKGSK